MRCKCRSRMDLRVRPVFVDGPGGPSYKQVPTSRLQARWRSHECPPLGGAIPGPSASERSFRQCRGASRGPRWSQNAAFGVRCKDFLPGRRIRGLPRGWRRSWGESRLRRWADQAGSNSRRHSPQVPMMNDRTRFAQTATEAIEKDGKNRRDRPRRKGWSGYAGSGPRRSLLEAPRSPLNRLANSPFRLPGAA